VAKFYYGGQAVMEGVMMRGRTSVAVAIRRPDDSIYLHEEALIVRWLLAPGLALQGLTTREPDDIMIECAITALKRVLQRDGLGGDNGREAGEAGEPALPPLAIFR
jgi:uncharacterized protein YqhQ